MEEIKTYKFDRNEAIRRIKEKSAAKGKEVVFFKAFPTNGDVAIDEKALAEVVKKEGITKISFLIDSFPMCAEVNRVTERLKELDCPAMITGNYLVIDEDSTERFISNQLIDIVDRMLPVKEVVFDASGSDGKVRECALQIVGILKEYGVKVRGCYK